jgi:hypothetical protein
VDSIEVLWPSGIKQTVPHAELNGLLEIVEGARATEVQEKK